MAVKVEALDHLVINVADVAVTAEWYRKILGMEVKVFDPGGRLLTVTSDEVDVSRVIQSAWRGFNAGGSAWTLVVGRSEQAEVTVTFLAGSTPRHRHQPRRQRLEQRPGQRRHLVEHARDLLRARIARQRDGIEPSAADCAKSQQIA